MSLKKNTAVTGFTFGLVSLSDGSPVTTGTPVGFFTLDGGTQTAINDTTPVHEGNGQWTFDLLAVEMNGDVVGLTFTHVDAISVYFTIITTTRLVSELNDFDATNDDVAVVTLVNANTDMRGTDSANTVAPDNTGIAAIQAVTDVIPDSGAMTSIAQGSDLATVDTVVDAIKVKTDDLTFTKANELDSNIKSVNDVTVTGTGADGDSWGP